MYQARSTDEVASAPLQSSHRHAPARPIRVVKGDCLRTMRKLADASFGVVVTSPPYNIGAPYKGYQDNLPRAEYLAWIARVGGEIARLLDEEGSLFLNIGGSNRDPWMPMDVAQSLREHFVLQNDITWVKSISVGDDTVGHFKPITSSRFLNNNAERIFHFTKSGSVKIDRLGIGVPFKDKSNIARWGHARDRRCRGNTWFIPYKTVRSKAQKFDHPCTFPEALAEQCLRLAGRPSARVLDPFLGTGSTLVAAQRLGMEALGIELNADYVHTARARIAGCDGDEG